MQFTCGEVPCEIIIHFAQADNIETYTQDVERGDDDKSKKDSVVVEDGECS